MSELIVGIGEVLWDILPQGKKLGGAPANFAYHISQFGFESKAISAIGNDKLGKEITDILNSREIGYYLQSNSFPTGIVDINIDRSGIPTYRIAENSAWDNIVFDEQLRLIAGSTKIACFGSLAQRSEISRKTINEFLDNMPDKENVHKIFDINLRQHYYTRTIITDSLEKCNILKINDEELAIINEMFKFGSSKINIVATEIMKRYEIKILILTCGVRGSFVFARNFESFIDTPQVKVADTVGAGDSFTAAFCAALLKGHSLKEAHEFAVQIAAFVCTQLGAMPVIPKELKRI